ncbi:DUF1516 family protein [Secundilactobacillus collinoides]|uniref:DUF1516 family protein n=1 Tax=Secundilactobacillus collinoides TaxID=33960 RepID=A0A166FVM7_SECCO|nr:DUF1516 family protein [Secundilactobacillus collinoides]KZL35860.1 hypothetical protein TY91_15150 [Secundilactobacillus collinoides]
MWLAIHSVSFVFLILCTIIGLNRTSEKRISQFLIVDRIIYLVIIISGIILLIRTFQHAPVLVGLREALELLLIVAIELAFGRKQERSLSTRLVVVLTVLILLIAGLGWWLAYRLP